MKANAARKYLTCPAPEQEAILTAWAHTARAIHNLALEQRQYLWDQRGYTMRAYEQAAHLTVARAEMPWVADLPAQCAQAVIVNLDKAYDNFWNPDHPAEFPAFHKRSHRPSITFPGQAVAVERISRKWGQVKLPKLGWIKFRWSRDLGGTVRSATLTKDALGWHVSFGIAVEREAVAPNGKSSVGVDFGIACSAYCSDKDEPDDMPPTMTPGEKHRLIGLERKKGRQVAFAKHHAGGKYSKRLRKTIRQIAQLRARQARRRNDFTHKFTTTLAKNHGWVAIEDLQVKNMTKSAKGSVDAPGKKVKQKSGLNKAILDNAWGERRRQLTYKAPRHGSELRVVPAPHTSQTCPACHTVDPESRKGCGRIFACTACGHTCHADRGASIEIERRGSQQEAVGLTVTSTHPARARGRKAPTRVNSSGLRQRHVA
jgi:putative transposase